MDIRADEPPMPTDARHMAADLARVRAIMSEGLPWSPFDGIPSLSLAGDRALHAEFLTRALPPDDDLRFLSQLVDGTEVGVFAERLPWDSEFFGYGVAKLHGVFALEEPLCRPDADFTPAVEALVAACRARGIHYLLALVDVRDLALIRALGVCGFALIETRPRYHLHLSSYAFPSRFACRPAVAADVESLAEAAAEAVNPYDRFHADPFVGHDAAARLLRRWVGASVCESFADVTLVPDTPRPAALVTLKYHRAKWPRWGVRLAQFGLAACSPRERGWGSKLFSEAHYHLKEMGVEYVTLLTQLPNRPMIRICEKLGYQLGGAELMFRLVC
jgi:dTDP-4-amino-4,6-dideoxy-D-galactose acyltransferase